MNSTGVIRRIDDLGRVVIPREIRRILRLREGDPLEIYISESGEVTLKKHSPLFTLKDFADSYASTLLEVTNHIVLIADTDRVVTVSGAPKSKLLNMPIWDLANKAMEKKSICHSNDPVGDFECKSQIVAPIMVEGDVVGVIALVLKYDDVRDVECKVIEVAAGFLGKELEG